MTKEIFTSKNPRGHSRWSLLFFYSIVAILIVLNVKGKVNAQITLTNDYQNFVSAPIGTFQGINFREAGFSGLYAIPNTNGREFWTVSDRGVNVDAANANPSACRPTYDKIYGFPGYAPKIHRIRLNADNSIQILQTITLKRPSGATASGLINPTGFGSTAAEIASTDTVLNCANFNAKTAAKDIWGIDSEGIVVDKEGFFWICEEGGPTIWKVNANGVVVKRFTPYANLVGAQSIDVQIDTVFKYRKNNRGFEGISITPNGKIYAIIQSPVLYPTKSVGEGTRIHRILEIDPATNATRMFAYLNDGIIGSGSNQIRLRDWKIGDMAAINDHTFLVMEAALRGTTDIKRVYLIDINGATPVTSALYGGKTLEALVDAAGLAANGITPVSKTLFMDLLATGWPAALDKAEGIAIVNDSTIAICNDNDYGQVSPLENGIATATTNLSHLMTFKLQGSSKLANFQPVVTALNQGVTGPSTSKTPYLLPSVPGAQFTSILTVTESVGGYMFAGLPDGTGAFDNGDGTFSVLINHEMGSTVGAVHAHGSRGAFVSKWVINKSDLSVVRGADLIQHVNIWNGSGYTTYNAANPSLLAAFGRFCSADLPAVPAFYNAATGLGTQSRIFMNGEEAGNEGRAFAHVATGPEAGVTYELPALGKLSYENAVACPSSGDKTVVISMDDSTPGQVYVYIGTKTNSGNEVEKAGLTNGRLYGVSVAGLFMETSASVPAPNTPFALIDLGSVVNMTGAALNTNSNNAGVTTFLRPEDGAWDPSNGNDFYFVTTNAFTSPSRLWKLSFTDINNPALGGKITAVLDGTEGQRMLDNMTIDNYGHALLQEDVGGQTHLGKTWQYNIATDQLKEVGTHDPARFIAGAPNFLTQDEEASGIIDVESILGKGMFIVVDQAHYGIPGDAVEGGQLLAFYNPDTYAASREIIVSGNGNEINDGDVTPSAADNTDFGTVNAGSSLVKSCVVKNEGPADLIVSNIALDGSDAFALTDSLAFPLHIAADSSMIIHVAFAPTTAEVSVATLHIANSDSDEGDFDVALQGDGCLLTVDSISGPANACAYAGTGVATYSVSATDASTYQWTLPARTTLVSGQGTNTITVKYATSFIAGNIAVKVGNACGGASVTETLFINKVRPAVPAYINGPVSACGYIATDSLVTYSIPAVAGATSYLWTLPAHVSMVAGQGTNSIQVKFNYGYTTAQIKVRAVAACASSADRALKVTAVAPGKPGIISGPTYGVCTPGNTVTYTVEPATYAAAYVWSTSVEGASIVTDSTTAVITFPSFVTGLVNVSANNGCGVSASRSIRIYATPATPLAIIGADTVCAGATETYYIDSIANATSYAWSVTNGSAIQSGNGTPAIQVAVGNANMEVRVRVVNNCGVSSVKRLPVTVENCSAAARSASSFTVYPVPSNGIIQIQFDAPKPEANLVAVNSVITNEVFYSLPGVSAEGKNQIELDLTFLPNGLYVLHFASPSVNKEVLIEIKK